MLRSILPVLPTDTLAPLRLVEESGARPSLHSPVCHPDKSIDRPYEIDGRQTVRDVGVRQNQGEDRDHWGIAKCRKVLGPSNKRGLKGYFSEGGCPGAEKTRKPCELQRSFWRGAIASPNAPPLKAGISASGRSG
jgi:hypothetical protein